MPVVEGGEVGVGGDGDIQSRPTSVPLDTYTCCSSCGTYPGRTRRSFRNVPSGRLVAGITLSRASPSAGSILMARWVSKGGFLMLSSQSLALGTSC